jgi:Tol biopolymer transport system component/DNA-binding winged helix-turn-helix (wHTH) protein
MHDPVEPTARPVIRFGTFEVDVAAGELRRQGVKTRLQEQPLKVLLLLLSRPGDIVTREELRAQLWPADTFVDFEHSLNAAVKRLRDALGDSADNPRFIETIPRRGYRFLGPVDDPGRPPAPAVSKAVALTIPRWAAAAAGIAVLVALVAAIGSTRWRSDPPPAGSGPVLTRLTSDTRLATDPAVSPDGSLLAYASDRTGEGNLDIWVQQLSGGAALRLTRHDAEDHEPSFSPDGTRIVFRSERDGGGIYVVSALGGEEKVIAPQGRRPRFSPKGDTIVYWTGSGWTGSGLGEMRGGDPTSGTSGMYVVPATGGPPRQLRPEFATARAPVWAPDGESILFLGVRDASLGARTLFDWWITPLGEGEPVATGILPAVRSHGLSAFTVPDAWVAGDRVLFADRRGDSRNIWEIAVSEHGRPAAAPRQLTFGTGAESQPSLAPGGRLVFSSHSSKIDIWALPVAANKGKVLGGLQRLTETAGQHIQPRLAANGKTLAYVSVESSKGDLWLKDLESGKQTALTISPSNEEQPLPSAAGSRVAYVARNARINPILFVSASGGVAEQVCDRCTESLNDWSADGSMMLHLRDQPRRVALLDVASGRSTDILQHARHNLYMSRFSPDGQWITFLAQTGPENRRLYVAPFAGETPIPVGEWIPLTDGRFSDDKPCLSPDGNLLYFTSNRDGFMCLWAQRLEPASKHPLGPAFPIHHFHSTWRSISNVPIGWLGVSVARDRIVFNQGELTGNIWMARTGEQR